MFSGKNPGTTRFIVFSVDVEALQRLLLMSTSWLSAKKRRKNGKMVFDLKLSHER